MANSITHLYRHNFPLAVWHIDRHYLALVPSNVSTSTSCVILKENTMQHRKRFISYFSKICRRFVCLLKPFSDCLGSNNRFPIYNTQPISCCYTYSKNSEKTKLDEKNIMHCAEKFNLKCIFYFLQYFILFQIANIGT